MSMATTEAPAANVRYLVEIDYAERTYGREAFG
jgi:hypothetical protein